MIRNRALRKATVAWILLATGLVLYTTAKLVLVFHGAVPFDSIGNDYILYENLAHNLLNGNGFSMEIAGGHTPTFLRLLGYPVFLAIVHSIFGENAKWIQLVQVLLSSITIVFACHLARCFGKTAAIACFVFMMLDPGWFVNGFLGNPETLAAFMLATGLVIWFSCQSSDQMLLGCLASGIILGAAGLTRPELFGVPVALVLISFRGSIKVISVLIVGVILVSAPWVARNHRLGFHGVSTTLGVNLAILAVRTGAIDPEMLQRELEPNISLGRYFEDSTRVADARLWAPFQNGRYVNDSGLSEREVDALFTGIALKAFRSHPWKAAQGVAMNFWRYATNYFDRPLGIGGRLYRLASLLLFGLAIIGWASDIGRPCERRLLMSCVLLPTILMTTTTFVYYRYRIPVTALVAVLGGIGMTDLLRRRQMALKREKRDRI